MKKNPVLESINLFPKQCLRAINEVEKLTLPFLKNKVDKKTVLCKVAFDMSDNQKISTKQHAAGTSLRYQSQVIHVNRCVLYFIKENPRGIV